VSVDVIAPDRGQVTVDLKTGVAVIRVARFFEEISRAFSNLMDQSTNVTDATVTADPITITWSTNEPTASTAQTIADGDSPSVLETGQAIQNIVTQINQLAADVGTNKDKINELLAALQTAEIMA